MNVKRRRSDLWSRNTTSSSRTWANVKLQPWKEANVLLNLLNFPFMLLLFIFFFPFHSKPAPCNHFPLIEALRLYIPPDPLSTETFSARLLSPMNFSSNAISITHTHSHSHARLRLKTSLQRLNPFDRDPFKKCFGPRRGRGPAAPGGNGWDRCIVHHRMLFNALSLLHVEQMELQHVHCANEPWSSWTSSWSPDPFNDFL